MGRDVRPHRHGRGSRSRRGGRCDRFCLRRRHGPLGKLGAQHYKDIDKLPPGSSRVAAARATASSQYLQGLMNAHVGSAGHESDIQAAFGKNNVANFASQMTTTIYQAMAGGKRSLKCTPWLYTQVVRRVARLQVARAKQRQGHRSNDIHASSLRCRPHRPVAERPSSPPPPVGVKGQTSNVSPTRKAREQAEASWAARPSGHTRTASASSMKEAGLTICDAATNSSWSPTNYNPAHPGHSGLDHDVAA